MYPNKEPEPSYVPRCAICQSQNIGVAPKKSSEELKLFCRECGTVTSLAGITWVRL